MGKMKKGLLTALAMILALAVLPPAGRAIQLIYFNTEILRDQFGNMLPDGSLVQIIYTPSGTREPPSIYSGMPTGDNVLWQTTVTSDGWIGGGISYPSSLIDGTGAVYVRFFNVPHLTGTGFYGMSPLHVLGSGIDPDFDPGVDFWDVTEMGLYLWTEYPFTIIPEPAAWMTMIPAMGMGLLAYRKSLKKKKPKEAGATAKT